MSEVEKITERYVAVYYKLYGLRRVKSKADFCRSVGVFYTNFWSIEQGKRSVTLDQVVRLVGHYGVSADWILLGKGCMFSE